MSRKVYKAVPAYKKDDEGNLIVTADTPKDQGGKWTVRADSKAFGFDIVFTGAGDEMSGGLEIGGGVPFTFDFADASQIVTSGVPSGYRRVRVDWQFNDRVYIKEGTIYFFNMPKGSYIDMSIVCPPGYPYGYRVHGRPSDRDREVLFDTAGAEEVTVQHWVIKNHLEGSCSMGDEFNTESAGEVAPPTYYIWRAEVTIPDIPNWQECHGHWTLELYRPSSVYFPDPT